MVDFVLLWLIHLIIIVVSIVVIRSAIDALCIYLLLGCKNLSNTVGSNLHIFSDNLENVLSTNIICCQLFGTDH
jgi:hypothetical protein